MKRLVIGLAFAATISPALAQVPPQTSAQSDDRRWEAVFNSQTSYYSFHSTPVFTVFNFNPSKGQQVFNPFGLQVTGKPTDDWKFQALVRSGYVWSKQTSGAVTGEYSGFTDTTVGTTATYNGLNGVQPFASVNVNIPTGETLAQGNSKFAKADSDVVSIPSFGEGLNIGATFGVNFALNSATIFSTGIGYTKRGHFDREGLILGTVLDMDPGDVLTPNASIAYRGERLSLSASVSYSTESTTTRDGIDFYKAGDRIFAAAGIGYAWNQNWASRLTGSFSHYAKNKVINPAIGLPPLILEAFNTNSDVTTVNFDTIYTQGNFSIGPTVGYLYRNNNGYNPVTFAFLPAKTKWSVGVVSQYAVTQQASFNLRVERMWLDENAKPGFYPDLSTDAWLVALGGIIKF